METEKDGKLPFLDVVIERQDDKLIYDVFRKPTNNLQYIHATSNHPVNHKLAAFNTSINRMNNIPLSNEKIEKETN